MKWYLKCWSQYADFTGRARRTEYWMFALVNFGIALLLELILGFTFLYFLTYAYSLAIFIPSLAVCVRRLHDIGRSGWWYLIGLIPVIGWILLIVWFCTDSQPGANKWGPNPKGF
ncbi:MAG: DUF805 domain-containing protein [Alistipes sp.]|nr:DUF805 domain-containing protein [Alistipes sp.]MBO7265812.1 DUF805 domain-containing protein [Alistipes sp.]